MYTQWNIIQPLKRKNLLTHAILCKNHKDITLSERSQTQQDKYCMTPPICGTDSSQTHTDTKKNGGFQGLGVEAMGSYYLRGSVKWDDESSGDSIVVMAAQQYECH